MFQLTRKEFTDLRSQFVTSKTKGRGGRRYMSYAFTEQGVAMLSIFEAIKQLLKPPELPEKPKRPIGFRTE